MPPSWATSARRHRPGSTPCCWRARRAWSGSAWTRPAPGSATCCTPARPRRGDHTGYKGSGNIAIGRLGDDQYAYLAAVEPFHGNTLALYTRDGAHDGVVGGTWERRVLEVFGEPNEAGEGPAHHVVCADFDGDGEDELLVALRGPMPHQGVFLYKFTDVRSGTFEKTRLSEASAARIAVADFDGDGRLDFATLGYYVPGYFLCEDPQLALFLNRYGSAGTRCTGHPDAAAGRVAVDAQRDAASPNRRILLDPGRQDGAAGDGGGASARSSASVTSIVSSRSSTRSSRSRSPSSSSPSSRSPGT